MPADPILASNPLDTRTLSYHDLAVAYGELWRKAAHLQAVADANVAIAQALRRSSVDEAQTRAALETTIVTLRESAEFDAEMRRSLSASMEELRKAVDDLQEALAREKDTADRAARSFLTAQAERDAAREETRSARQATLDLGRDLTRQMDVLKEESAAAVLREREECAARAHAQARGCVATGPETYTSGYIAGCAAAAAAIRSRGGQ